VDSEEKMTARPVLAGKGIGLPDVLRSSRYRYTIIIPLSTAGAIIRGSTIRLATLNFTSKSPMNPRVQSDPTAKGVSARRAGDMARKVRKARKVIPRNA
jgi:hypothetical protein